MSQMHESMIQNLDVRHVDMKEMLANIENKKPGDEELNMTKEENQDHQETEVADVFGDWWVTIKNSKNKDIIFTFHPSLIKY